MEHRKKKEPALGSAENDVEQGYVCSITNKAFAHHYCCNVYAFTH
jgi:hypothetical protein